MGKTKAKSHLVSKVRAHVGEEKKSMEEKKSKEEKKRKKKEGEVQISRYVCLRIICILDS